RYVGALAADPLPAAGLAPVALAEKEGLALINGTEGMLGTLVLTLTDLRLGTCRLVSRRLMFSRERHRHSSLWGYALTPACPHAGGWHQMGICDGLLPEWVA